MDAWLRIAEGRAARRSPRRRWRLLFAGASRPSCWCWQLHRWPKWRFSSARQNACSLMVLGLVASVALASGSLLKAFTMIVLGLLHEIVGGGVTWRPAPEPFARSPEMADELVPLWRSAWACRRWGAAASTRGARAYPLRHGQACERTDAVEGQLKRIVGPSCVARPSSEVLGILPEVARRAGVVCRLHHGKEDVANQAGSAKAPSRGWRPRNAQRRQRTTFLIPMLNLGIQAIR